MNFKENHLLNFNDFSLYVRNNFSPYDKALIVSKHLKNYCFFYKNKLHYCFDDSEEFKETEINTERYLLTLLSAYLSFSVKSLADTDLQLLNLIPCFNTICENESILKYFPQLMVLLEMADDEILEIEEENITLTLAESEPQYQTLDDGETYCINKQTDDLTADEMTELVNELSF